MLSLRGVSKAYGQASRRVVLRDLDFELGEGQFVAIMGESGTGKSTLLNLIAGLDTPDDGRVILNGADLGTLDDDALSRLRALHLGFVFQAFHLLPHLTVAENVALPLALAGRPAEEWPKQIEAMLASVHMAGRQADYPTVLSGGEMQRVAIARALVHAPRLLLADEPTGNLDAESAVQVLELLRARVRDEGCSTILVTHSAAAAATADRVYRLDASGLNPVA